MKKKKKPNYKLRRTIAKIVIVLLILLPIVLINLNKIKNLTIYIPNIKYSKVIDSLFDANFTSDEVKSTIDYLKEKKKINDNTSEYILALNNKGYKKSTIDFIIKNLDKKQITEFLAKKYNKDYDEYIVNDLFDYSKFERYLDYQKEHDKLTVDEVIYRVELNLDKDFYDYAVDVKNPDDVTVLTNKYLQIPEHYEPSDLVDMSDDYANNYFGQVKVRKEVYDAFVKMCDASRKEGVTFLADNAYRDFEYQEIIYNNYVYENGQEYADKYAAKPGFSEHQLGLALDLANIWTITENGEEYKWLDKNAHKYGFIIRYKKQWEEVTGYAAESWHIRYVGVETATKLHEKNMSYEEYYIKYIANNKKK